MNQQQNIRREILRLVQARHNSACINTSRLSSFYHVTETEVRRELAKLAEERIIQLAGWDGRALRPFREWLSADEFVSKAADGHVHVEMEMETAKAVCA